MFGLCQTTVQHEGNQKLTGTFTVSDHSVCARRRHITLLRCVVREDLSMAMVSAVTCFAGRGMFQ